jgi:hypothetical protein|uniref:Uncharacterized protein n=1 Tax=Populus trichocarpa TaxID=3694 RepID=A0A2K1ZRP7_POPTR
MGGGSTSAEIRDPNRKQLNKEQKDQTCISPTEREREDTPLHGFCFLHKIHSCQVHNVQQENIHVDKGFKTQIEILKNTSHPQSKGITNQYPVLFLLLEISIEFCRTKTAYNFEGKKKQSSASLRHCLLIW